MADTAPQTTESDSQTSQQSESYSLLDPLQRCNFEQKPLLNGNAQEKQEDNKEKGGFGKWKIVGYFVPGALFAGAFLFQNLCLHAATHYYVQWMFRLRANLGSDKDGTESTISGEQLSTQIEDGSLHDPIAGLLGYHDIPVAAMDALSALVPFTWFILVIGRGNIHIWTKCCFCGALLAFFKGVCSVATIVPDSTGWDNCKARLGDDGVKYFKEAENLDFGGDWLTALKDLFTLELLGAVTPGGNVRHLRYCADMVYSGHTYFVTLFALGLYDLTRRVSRQYVSKTPRRMLLILVGTVLAILVMLDVVMILINRFHYTLDVLLAVLLTVLFYTNTIVGISVEWWVDLFRTGKSTTNEGASGASSPTSTETDENDGEVLIPPCCIPCWWWPGRRHLIQSEADPEKAD
eukprot:TRINITY_DN27308_c0_g1_i1.p1 TRINITY_DN27308_c0_g1~~TRINITY_DN27308_c0_g1_i1.p1  ORF type:complete len:406 (+),score=34.74 TRINITY_DN27308_c0_g1_i1:136-1353(+)